MSISQKTDGSSLPSLPADGGSIQVQISKTLLFSPPTPPWGMGEVQRGRSVYPPALLSKPSWVGRRVSFFVSIPLSPPRVIKKAESPSPLPSYPPQPPSPLCSLKSSPPLPFLSVWLGRRGKKQEGLDYPTRQNQARARLTQARGLRIKNPLISHLRLEQQFCSLGLDPG